VKSLSANGRGPSPGSRTDLRRKRVDKDESASAIYRLYRLLLRRSQMSSVGQGNNRPNDERGSALFPDHLHRNRGHAIRHGHVLLMTPRLSCQICSV
jgi:hypothetical protein